MVEYSKDRFACEVLDGQVIDDRYKVIDEIIYYRDRIFLIEGSQLKKKILQASHDSPCPAIRGLPKPTGPSERGSHGRASRRKYSGMLGRVKFVRGTRGR